MTHNIELIEERLEIAKVFREKYPNAPGELQSQDLRLTIPKVDCAEAGKVFGKSGWIREVAYYGNEFNWTRVIDGVTITIYGAEENQFNKSEVPSSAFPIQLED